MRADQLEKLKELQERWLDITLDEMDEPIVAAGLTSAKLTKDERGDRYWQKRNVGAALTICTKMDMLRARLERAAYLDSPPTDAEGEDIDNTDIDNEMNALAAKAEELFNEFTASRKTQH